MQPMDIRRTPRPNCFAGRPVISDFGLVPNKSAKYPVNTHNHFDHLGGVGTYFAEGATIITSAMNRSPPMPVPSRRSCY